MDLDLLMTSSIRAFATVARWERPTSAPLSASIDQPGRFEQGPDEKNGREGFMDGFIFKVKIPLGGLRIQS